ncbi:hypothetical protein [Hespellia stercorisuis]|uniref:Uncharacterized protein n=1 Tax=Hespellia stercorisuis DSM 15480 TaxID=1121950 RepID=A0A1M6KV01_9FIRM|nr:hypothetical protein [Hespellia stercorisuis]SHJ62743.1 hypothetical protein SAMN02745243_00993 [Hespellia stercorisuis DSM 15480]
MNEKESKKYVRKKGGVEGMKIMQEMTKIKDKSKQMAWRTVIKTKNVCARAGEQVKNKLQDESGIGVVEVILILVGILTTYYRVSIRCMK